MPSSATDTNAAFRRRRRCTMHRNRPAPNPYPASSGLPTGAASLDCPSTAPKAPSCTCTTRCLSTPPPPPSPAAHLGSPLDAARPSGPSGLPPRASPEDPSCNRRRYQNEALGDWGCTGWIAAQEPSKIKARSGARCHD